MGLHGLGVCLQDFRHGQQPQVLYCEDQVAISLQILRGIPWSMGATGGICHHFWPLWPQLVLTAPPPNEAKVEAVYPNLTQHAPQA